MDGHVGNKLKLVRELTPLFRGFGRSMTNSPMVLAWAPSSGGITISQRIATQKVMPTVDSSPPKVATLHNGLSVVSQATY